MDALLLFFMNKVTLEVESVCVRILPDSDPTKIEEMPCILFRLEYLWYKMMKDKQKLNEELPLPGVLKILNNKVIEIG